MPRPDNVRRQLPGARLRLASLQRRAASLPAAESRLVPETLGELERSLVELEVACEHAQEVIEDLAVKETDHARTLSRYRQLFDGSPDPSIITTLDGIIVEVNRAGSALLHVSPGWLRNKPLDLYVEERALFSRALVHEYAPGELGDPIAMTIRPRERAPIPVTARVHILSPPDGDPELVWSFQSRPRP